MSKAKASLRMAGSVFTALLLAAMFFLAAAIQLVPMAMGGSSLVILTGSMKPTINPGDIIAVRTVAPQDIRVGDVVTFQPVSDDPKLVTHRVVSKSVGPKGAIGFVTRGDNNGKDDAPIVGDQVKGLFVYRIPQLGWALNALGGPGSGSVKIAAAVLIMGAAWLVFVPRRRSKVVKTGDETAESAAPRRMLADQKVGIRA